MVISVTHLGVLTVADNVRDARELSVHEQLESLRQDMDKVLTHLFADVAEVKATESQVEVTKNEGGF